MLILIGRDINIGVDMQALSFSWGGGGGGGLEMMYSE